MSQLIQSPRAGLGHSKEFKLRQLWVRCENREFAWLKKVIL